MGVILSVLLISLAFTETKCLLTLLLSELINRFNRVTDTNSYNIQRTRECDRDQTIRQQETRNACTYACRRPTLTVHRSPSDNHRVTNLTNQEKKRKMISTELPEMVCRVTITTTVRTKTTTRTPTTTTTRTSTTTARTPTTTTTRTTTTI